MTSRLSVILLLLLLVCTPLAAQDETLPPNDDNETTNWGTDCSTPCNSTDCTLAVDEDPGSPDGNFVGSNTDNALMIWDFATPASSPSTAANAQNFDLTVSRCNTSCAEDAGGSDPQYALKLFCNGVEKLTITGATNVTGLDTRFSSNTFTYTTDGDCDSAGANVELQVYNNCVGGGSNTRCVCVEAIEWEVTYAAGAAKRRAMVIGK